MKSHPMTSWNVQRLQQPVHVNTLQRLMTCIHYVVTDVISLSRQQLVLLYSNNTLLAVYLFRLSTYVDQYEIIKSL